MSNLTKRLRHVAWLAEEGSEVVDLAAAAEIERLRTALAIAAGMLSTYVVVGDSHPETMLNELLAEADKAIDKEANR